MKRIYLLIVGIVCCVAVFYLENTGSYFGRFINQFAPCVQNIENSFPCFGFYDIGLILAAMLLGVIFLGMIGYEIFQKIAEVMKRHP